MSTSPTQPSKPVLFWTKEEIEVERLFPIRNLIVDHPNPTFPLFDSGSPTPSNTASIDESDATVRPDAVSSPNCNDGDSEQPTLSSTASHGCQPPPYSSTPPPVVARRLSISTGSPDGRSISEEAQYLQAISERSQMIPHKAAGDEPPGIPQGLSVDSTCYRCEDEAIHIPGAIQQFGALIALRYDTEGNLKVRIASENTKKVLHYSPHQLFDLESFLDILEPEVLEDFVTRVRHALAIGTNEATQTHLDVFTMSVTSSAGTQVQVWCAIHISQSSQDLVICEFEENSECFPLPADLNDEKVFPTTPTRTIDNEVSPEERIKSTTSMSEPLRVLQLARRSHRKRLGSMEMYNAMTQTQQQLGGAKTIDSLLDIVVGLVAELTGFHRVMIYRFDNYKNGCVVSELIDPKASDDLFRGLNFPASDIPKQARDLYIINRIRVLYDRGEESARFLGRDPTDFDKPLDLTHSYLRAMSPIHLKYLANMGVRSSMSISIVIDNDLWGLVTCHHYGHKAIRVSLPIRELCRNIGECASTNIDRLLMLKRLQARKPPSTILPRQNPSGFLTASSTDLLRVFDADFGLLSIQDEVRAIGRLDPYREALALLAHLKSNRMPEIIASQNINEDFKDLKYAPGIHTIAGLLFIPLTMGGNDFIVFFRKGQLKEVRWAGNPYEKVTKLGSLYLEPRGSFKRWTESVVDLSMEWTEDQMDTAFILKDFMDVWRSKESTGQKNRMTRLLLQNSSHEVRTPLNAIVNYLEIGLESAIDDATREILEKAYKASKSLIYVIDDLLNLTKVEDGRVASVHEILDLTTTVSDVITPFRKEAMRKNLDLTVSTHPGIPEMVKGDSARLRQTLSNIISNAFQNSDEGGIKVDIRPLKIREDSSIIEITVQDAGIGMSEKQLDDLFQEFEQVLGDEDNRSSTASTPASAGEPVIKEPLGLGLAVVARYVRNMNGQIRVRSQLGKGTIFGIELPFEHAHQRPESIPSGLSSPEQSVASLRRSSVENVSLGKKDSLEGFIPELVRAAEGSITSSRSGWAEGTTSTATTTPIKAPLEFFPDTQKINPPIEPLSVLIAEDNPINAKIMSRRLSKVGHTIEIASDGQTCHDYFVSKPESVDVILMDLQMPLVDGHQATRMIRRVEKSLEELRKIRPRVPIMAVSASLTEGSRFEYIECGFDAWILKPVDFSRLDFLLRGIENPEFRQQAQYKVGFWDKGGWFFS